MIRPARFQDAPAIERLIRDQHARSKYAGRVEISDKALNQLVMAALAGMTQSGPQASHVSVAVRDGKIVGFIMGTLDRVYHIGKKLTANDLYFVNEGGTTGDTLKLLDAYVAWAKSNPKVLEVMVSWADTLPGAGRVAELYRRKGFQKSGEMFEMRLDLQVEAEARGELENV